MAKFIKNLKFIFNPNWWIMNSPYRRELDVMLSKLLDEHEFINIGTHTAYIGGIELWTANYPYASMTPIDFNFRPSRLTIERAKKKLREAEIKKLIKLLQNER